MNLYVTKSACGITYSQPTNGSLELTCIVVSVLRNGIPINKSSINVKSPIDYSTLVGEPPTEVLDGVFLLKRKSHEQKPQSQKFQHPANFFAINSRPSPCNTPTLKMRKAACSAKAAKHLLKIV